MKTGWRVVTVLTVGLAVGRQGSAEPNTGTHALDLLGRLPLAFEENQGQTDPRVQKAGLMFRP